MSEQSSPIPSDPSEAGVVPLAQAKQLCSEYGLSMPELAAALVPFAEALAQPVISGFKVGAVAQGTTGSLYYGANVEFPGQALPFTIHAEQSATTNAWENGEQGVVTLVISAAPCGYCRQFLWETAQAAAMEVLLADLDPISLSPGLLPDPFGPGDLHVTSALMAPAPPVALTLTQPTDDPLTLAALVAASMSYAPYTSSWAGVAVETTAGQTFTGRVAENAAYNPSVSPMEGAVAMLSLAGLGEEEVSRVVLVELAEPTATQVPPTAALAAALQAPLTVATAVVAAG